MVDCAYKTDTNQCQHKNVHVKDQVVNDKICGICKLGSNFVELDNLRKSLPEPEVKPYTTAQVAVSFGKSVTKHGIALLTKGKDAYVPLEIYQERMSTCKDCKHYQSGACEICTCNLKRKCRWNTERCPIGKWEEYHEPENTE